MPLQPYAPGRSQRAVEALAAVHLLMVGELYVLGLLARGSPDAWVKTEAGERPELFTVEPGLVSVPDLRRDADTGQVMPARCVRFTLPSGRGRRHPRDGWVLVLFIGNDFIVQPAQVQRALPGTSPTATTS